MQTFSSCLRLLSTLSAVAITLSAVAASAPPTVTLDAGTVQGVLDHDIVVFRGIPYAAPPVGALRWKPTMPAVRWTGIRPATAFGAACPQPKIFKQAWAQVGPTSEDCLFLNVWRPAGARQRLPVMVFFHGGGFSLGSSGIPLYDGANLARRGAVIVTLNYRLGRLGFFAHPTITAEDPAAALGNYGLMDMLEALKWVQVNVATFGGDPHNVTIFGESAGAGAVQIFLTSHAADGLFAKAISESGAGAEVLAPLQGAASAEAAGTQWSDTLKLPEVTAASLRALPAEQIATAGAFPMLDGSLIRYSPGDAFRHGEQKKLPLIIGSNSFEASLAGYSDQVAHTLLGAHYEDLLEDYRHQAPTQPGAEVRLRGDVDAVEPSRIEADRLAQTGARVFTYYFKQLPVNQRGTLPGAPHGGELAYVFGNLAVEDQWDDSERAVSKVIGDYWVQFAKSGNPNHAGAPEWRPVTASASAFLSVDAHTQMSEPSALEIKTKQLTLDGSASNWDAQHPP